MRIVIDIPNGCYEELNNGQFPVQDAYRLVAWIKNGTPLPDGVEILTKEAYSDLCTRAVEQPEKRTEERTETHACDCISRQAAFIALNKRAENVSLKTRIGLLDAVRVIDELPSVEPERKPGYWTHDEDGWKCGTCHNKIREEDFPTRMGAPIYNYCPMCGEDMRGV